MKKRTAVRAIIHNNGKILAAKLKAPDGIINPYWCTLGGGLHEKESLVPALERELLEETGIDADVGRLVFIQQFYEQERDTEHLEFFFEINNSDDFLDLDIDNTSHGKNEINQIEFVDPKSVRILPECLKSLD